MNVCCSRLLLKNYPDSRQPNYQGLVCLPILYIRVEGPRNKRRGGLCRRYPETGLEEINGDLLEADFWPDFKCRPKTAHLLRRHYLVRRNSRKIPVEWLYRKPKAMIRVRVFVGSPNDVESFRDVILGVIERLRPDLEVDDIALVAKDWRRVVGDIGEPQSQL